MSYRFCSKFHALSSSVKLFENRLKFDNVTQSLNVGTFIPSPAEIEFGAFLALKSDICLQQI